MLKNRNQTELNCAQAVMPLVFQYNCEELEELLDDMLINAVTSQRAKDGGFISDHIAVWDHLRMFIRRVSPLRKELLQSKKAH